MPEPTREQKLETIAFFMTEVVGPFMDSNSTLLGDYKDTYIGDHKELDYAAAGEQFDTLCDMAVEFLSELVKDG